MNGPAAEALDIRLKPHWHAGSVDYLQVTGTCGPQLVPTDPLLVYAVSTVNIPFADYRSLSLEDDHGAVPFEVKDFPVERSFVVRKGVFPGRPPSGRLTWSYEVLPRVLPDDYRSSPYFDFRAEPGGFNSAGLTFLMLPQEGLVDLTLCWDLSSMPAGSRGVWSFGAGDARRTETIENIAFTYYAAGQLNAVEADEFGIYWFGDPPFPVCDVTGRVRDLFAWMSVFFQDANPVYRVFLRRDPFDLSGGGTALRRSFMSGYSDKTIPDMNDWFATLAHEMVHNWPHMNDEPAGKGTWFTEGIAEYYSTLLPFRAGLVGAEETVRQINRKAARYLESPLRDLSNEALAEIYWSDRRAQPVPYGRGMLYLASVDAELKATGHTGIDELAVRFTPGHEMEPADWEDFIKSNLGAAGIRAYEDMKAGKLVRPHPGSFDAAFDLCETMIDIEGKPAVSYEFVVRNQESDDEC